MGWAMGVWGGTPCTSAPMSALRTGLHQPLLTGLMCEQMKAADLRQRRLHLLSARRRLFVFTFSFCSCRCGTDIGGKCIYGSSAAFFLCVVVVVAGVAISAWRNSIHRRCLRFSSFLCFSGGGGKFVPGMRMLRSRHTFWHDPLR